MARIAEYKAYLKSMATFDQLENERKAHAAAINVQGKKQARIHEKRGPASRKKYSWRSYERRYPAVRHSAGCESIRQWYPLYRCQCRATTR